MPDFLSHEGHDLHLQLLDDGVVIAEDNVEPSDDRYEEVCQ